MTSLCLSKATNDQLMTILRHDHSIPNNLLKQVLEEAINRRLLKGYAIDNITKFYGDVRPFMQQFNVTMDDLIQIAYMAILKAAETFKEGKAGFTTWLALPIKGALYTFTRDNKAEKRVVELVSINAPVHEELTLGDMLPSRISVEKQVIRKIRVEELLNNVDEQRREVVWLYMQGYTFGEIAKQMNVTRQRVNFLYHQSIERIKEQIA